MTITKQQSANAQSLDQASVEPIREAFGGLLISPDHPGYDEARKVWNGMIDKRPALIARCTGTADVRCAVRFAREHDLLVAVRGGGHNVAGTAVCDGGLVIDLSRMKGMRVDPVQCTARAQPGLLWGEFDRETQAFGLACPGGIVTHTGIAGLTLGGGFGWLQRKYGLTCDNLRSVDVVTADGEFLTVNAEDHADLFWGIRGGGGNFGIVTSFEYELHDVGPQILAGVLVHPAESAIQALHFYREYISEVPDDLTVFVALRNAPPAPWLPDHLHGDPVLIFAVCYSGSNIGEGERLLQPLRSFGQPLVDLIRPTAYTTHQGFFDATVPHGLRYYWKSHYLRSLSDDAIASIVSHAWRMRSPGSYSLLFQLGGAISKVREHDSAFSGRDAPHAITLDGVSSEEGQDDIEWVQDYFSSLRPFSTGGVYMNFLGTEGQDRVRASYGADKYDRLVALKNKYDPTNFFRVNQNIEPTV